MNYILLIVPKKRKKKSTNAHHNTKSREWEIFDEFQCTNSCFWSPSSYSLEQYSQGDFCVPKKLKLTSSPKPQTPKAKKRIRIEKIIMESQWIVAFLFHDPVEFTLICFAIFKGLWKGKMTHAHLSSDTSPFSLTLWFFGHYRLQFQVIFNYIVILLSFFFFFLGY